MNISPIQTTNELKFIYSKGINTYFLPLNLETLLFCKINKLNYFDPIEYFDNDFHEYALDKTLKFTKELPKISKYVSIQTEFVAALRFFYHQIIYLEDFINKIIESTEISHIIVSGWDFTRNIIYSSENYFTTRSILLHRVRHSLSSLILNISSSIQ